MRIIFASNNENKVKELQEILGVKIVTLNDLNITEDIEEFGKTFEQNALIKAQYIATKYPDDIVISDDSGLEVKALDYRPGIYSKRFAMNEKGYKENVDKTNNQYLLDLLKDETDRSARYVCSVVVCQKSSESVVVFNGFVDGEIASQMSGDNGFGYDFVFKHQGKYLSHMTSEEKNKISHRYNALKKVKESGILNV